MSLTDTLLAGLILAAVSGLTLVAYRHPRGYRKLFRPLVFGFANLSILRMGYRLGRIQGTLDALEGATPTAEACKDVFSNLSYQMKDLRWTFGITILTTAYLIFLYFLPHILDLEQSPTITKESTEDEPSPAATEAGKSA